MIVFLLPSAPNYPIVCARLLAHTIGNGPTLPNALSARFTLHRINHQEAYSLKDELQTHTNNAEGFFSRMRRGEIGHHHHVAGPYLVRFAQEAAWREDHKREANGAQVDRIVALAMANKPSIDFCGYWQRGRTA
jgi:hypothetical protein